MLIKSDFFEKPPEMELTPEAVFENYAKLVGMDECEKKRDWKIYNMSERMKLAKKVRRDLEKDGKLGRPVVDMGSEWGGMSYALLEEGLNVISVENDFENYLVSRAVNENTVQEDAFALKLDEQAGALVSYMFLGACMPGRADESGTPEAARKNMERVRRTFEGLASSYNTDTVYCVELQRELYCLFGWHALDERQIEEKMKEALPGWDVESLEGFGVFVGDMEDRLGFRLTRKDKAAGKKL